MADQVSNRVDRIRKPQYCLKNPHSQKIYANNCVQPAPDPSDYIDFLRHIKKGSLWDPPLATLALLPTNSPSIWQDCSNILNSAHHVKTLLPVHPDSGISTIKTRRSNGQLQHGVSVYKSSNCGLSWTPQSPLWRWCPGIVQTVLTSTYFCFYGHF